jgi:hypothetical protein
MVLMLSFNSATRSTHGEKRYTRGFTRNTSVDGEKKNDSTTNGSRACCPFVERSNRFTIPPFRDVLDDFQPPKRSQNNSTAR